MSVQVKGSGTIGGLDEGLVVSGIVTSSTQINVGSNIKIGNAGVVTATSFVGDGSNLTGITGTTINNNADNRIITGSGTANTLQGESTLTYNGSGTLEINDSGSSYTLRGAGVTKHEIAASASDNDLVIQNNKNQGNITSNIIFKGSGSGGETVKERLRIDSSGRLLIGTSSASNRFKNGNGNGATPKFQFETANVDEQNDISLTFGRNNAFGAEIILAKHRAATVGGYTVVQSGDRLGGINFAGSDGTHFRPAALIQGRVDGTPGTADMPGRLEFLTTADGAATPTEKLRITSDGKVGINQSSPGGSGLDITTSRTTHYSDTTDQRSLANLVLRQTSDAPDRFCSLSFVNGGGTQAEASINLVQTGNYEGDLRFKFRAGGGSADWRERFRITSAGQVKMAHQPTFYATANSGGTVTMTSTHTLTNWRLSTSGRTYDVGSNFNTSNGRFTAPIQGTYLFTGSILLQQYDQASGIHMMWRKNGSTMQYWYNTRTSDIDRSGYGGYLAQGSTTTFTLNANDYVDVACNFSGSLKLWCGDANWGHFSGHFLG